MRSLIVTADDIGLHRGMTAGAIRAHREGIVTACSIVASGEAFDDAVARLRDVPSLEVGVHLTLVEERSLTGMRFPRRWPLFVPMYLAGAVRLREIEKELRAQVETVAATGLRVTHLNGHQHLHVLPGIFAVVLQLAREFEVPYVRIIDDRGSTARRVPMGALNRFGRRARRHCRSAGQLSNDFTIGVAEAGHLASIGSLLESVEGITELVTHPGVNVDGYSWGYDWDGETAALCDPRLRDTIERLGIRLTTPSRANL